MHQDGLIHIHGATKESNDIILSMDKLELMNSS